MRHVTGGWRAGKNLKILLQMALLTMGICSCRVSRLLVGPGQSRGGSRVSFSSIVSACISRRQSDLAFMSHEIDWFHQKT